jgi:hypothetical protein
LKTALSLLFASWLLNAGQINIRLYDLSGIAPASLDMGMLVASQIYAQTDVRLDWEVGDPAAPEAHETDQTAALAVHKPRIRSYLTVRIARGLEQRTPATALGIAYPYAQLGVNATIFEERIENTSKELGVSYGVLLGYAIAHELGHSIPGLEDHSSTGIMRARWGPAEFRDVQAGTLGFSAEQAGRIRQFALEQERTRLGSLDTEPTDRLPEAGDVEFAALVFKRMGTGYGGGPVFVWTSAPGKNRLIVTP